MDVLLLGGSPASEVDADAVLPALGLLGHAVRVAPMDAAAGLSGAAPDVILVDARDDLAPARSACRLLLAMGQGTPVVAVVTEGGLAAVNESWGIDDLLLQTARPAEVEARLRLCTARRSAPSAPGEEPGLLRVGDLVIEEHSYTARLRGDLLDLTYKEFELLKFLAQTPGRVYSRAQLLQEVWGYDYFGGTRTVDVHVRRLRAKLGPEHEAMIGTVRHVGYKFVRPSD